MTRPPNVLLILSDQQRADTLGCLGRTPCGTPALDALARDGVLFERAATPCPLCLPARSALFSGVYPHENDMLDNETSTLGHSAFLETLRAAGYRVDYAGKWHLGTDNIGRFTDRHAAIHPEDYSQWCKDHGRADGWALNDPATRTHREPHMTTPRDATAVVDAEHTIDAWIADHAIELMRSRELDTPFVLVCSFQGPHPPFVVPEPYRSAFDPRAIAPPTNFGPCDDEPRSNRTSFYRSLFSDHGRSFEAWRPSIAAYWGFVGLIDDQVGRLLRTLDAEGLRDDTAVVFASDHGEMLGQHGLWHKMEPYEESIRIPLIVRAPWRVPRGVRTTATASLLDVGPTILSLCGLPACATLRGTDLTCELDDGRLLFAEHRPLGPWNGTVDWRLVAEQHGFKYVWRRGDRDELFDLRSDPGERDNRLDDAAHAANLARLRSELDRWMAATSDPLHEAFRADLDASSRGLPRSVRPDS